MWNYVRELQGSERRLAMALIGLAEQHVDEPDIRAGGRLLAWWSQHHVEALAPFAERCRPHVGLEPAEPIPMLAAEPSPTSGLLLDDLHAAWLLAQDVHLRWTVLGQTARVLRDRELAVACAGMGRETDRQLAWLHTRIVATAPQTLIAGP